MTSSQFRPLTSCIMPTANRRAFLPQAIACFLRQDYPEKELIVVDDGSDAVGDLIPNDERIRYFRLESRQTVGDKRNFACEQARGEIVAHWDDDDWHAPHRLRYQVESLLSGADICGIQTLLFYDSRSGEAWKYVYPANGATPAWLSGSTLCYKREQWLKSRFASLDVGEDARFVSDHQTARLLPLSDHTFHVGIIHAGNISPKQTTDACWQPYPSNQLRSLFGQDYQHYQFNAGSQVNEDSQTLHDPQVSVSTNSDEPQTGREIVSMMTVARQSDLLLPEFKALNQKTALPRMRQWELPFLLSQARLSDTMALLDCTINPAGFEQKLRQLYPHLLYRHWNPIQNNQFVMPDGFPDDSFDRVFCINTLEHLLQPQRDALMAEFARKLKPGGRLILTCDYYFDSFWNHTATLQAGVQLGLMSAGRQEVLGGFNQVTPAELMTLSSRHGLQPSETSWEEPREDDPALYRQDNPFPHACIGGSFTKLPLSELTASSPSACKKIALALLTWNMREISLDSVRAYLQEARMLKRLGHEPMLIVCDNGSTDGTAEALTALEQAIEIPCRLILNPQNRGSSIARNQIIDAALATEADYLLFMDGDIEIVPFSSFAMLRYMENSGRRLGCIGAHSSWHAPERAQVSDSFFAIDNANVLTTNLVAWTQYGLFRCQMFREGIRFDEASPFGEPGWGFEDNDLAFQMEMKGYLNKYFSGMIYLHRALHSSIGILRQTGFDPSSLYHQRRQYLINKWGAVKQISNGPLDDIRRVIMPLNA